MRKSLLLLIFTVVVALAAAEAFVRWKIPAEQKPPPRPSGWAVVPEESWVEYHPRLGWAHQRSKQCVLRKNNQEIALSTNSLGLRGNREYARSKPHGVTRIYALGDSFVFGFGVLDSDTFPAQMESSEPSYEVMNLGVPGYGIDQIYLSLGEFGYAYAPDIVLIAVYPEDFWRATRSFSDAGHGKPYFVRRPDGSLELRHQPVPPDKNFSVDQFPDQIMQNRIERFLWHSHLYRLLRRAWIRTLKLAGRADPDSSNEWILGRAILERMVGDIKGRHVRPVILIVPPQRWITGTLEPVRDSLIRFGQVQGVEVLDLTPVFRDALREAPVETWYIANDHHWTAAGNRLVADYLLRYFAKPS